MSGNIYINRKFIYENDPYSENGNKVVLNQTVIK